MEWVDDPIWVHCHECGEFWCNIHQQHAFECECPSVDVWNEWEIDPYTFSTRAYMGDE